MKITNLRPKEGNWFELDSDGYLVVKDGRFTKCMANKDYFDFDVVQPEYKVGDVVKVKTTTDTGYTKPGIEYKGLITQIETKKQERKIQ